MTFLALVFEVIPYRVLKGLSTGQGERRGKGLCTCVYCNTFQAQASCAAAAVHLQWQDVGQAEPFSVHVQNSVYMQNNEFSIQPQHVIVVLASSSAPVDLAATRSQEAA